jgi:hypothetical protein
MTFYGRADGTWTVLGYDSIEDWLTQQDEAAFEVVPAEQLRVAVSALEKLRERAAENFQGCDDMDSSWVYDVADDALTVLGEAA